MTTELVSAAALAWIVTVFVGGLSGLWLVYDTANLVRMRGADHSDPLVRDRRFGYVLGIVIGAIGVIGCLRYHAVI